ncbi:fluoride efflux transporter CrcB [soil metagenome]
MIHLYVALGGALGALARFAIGGWVTTWAGPGFPWGTFVINVSGSLLLGFLMRVLPSPAASSEARALLTVGLCGGFTTFSTFDFETLVLLQERLYGLAALYSLGSVLTCLAGVFAGMSLGTVAREGLVGRTS